MTARQFPVTPDQYFRLLEARNTWPKRLGLFAYGFFNPERHCTDGYLATRAGLTREDITDWIGQVIFPGARVRISKYFGIPEHLLLKWEYVNNRRILELPGSRSRRMLGEFDSFLDSVSLVAEAEERALAPASTPAYT